MAKLVSKTYGDALFEVAKESERIDTFFEETEGLLTVLRENADLSKLMNHPKIVKEEKISMIENIFKGQVCDEIVGLLRMIVDKGHFNELEAVLEYFLDTVKEYKNIGVAYVTTPMELSEKQKQQVVDKLLATTRYVKFEMHYRIDTALIGGMVIRIGDRVIDGSVKTKLYDLTRELSKIQLKVGECAP